MRISHLVFIGLCAAWVSFVMLSPESQPVIEDEGHAVVLGHAVASLWLPAIFYGVYMLVTRRQSKERSASPVGGNK